jgi:hypothetical protein
MVTRKFIVYAAGTGVSALLISGCGGDSPLPPQAAQACGIGAACVTTVAGTGEAGNMNGPAQAAQFWMPHSVAVDVESNVHVADYGNNNHTRLISQGSVSTPLEDPISFPLPANVATDASGNKYVADTYGNRVLKVTPAGETTVLAGTGRAGEEDGHASTATFSLPTGLAFDAHGALYVADMGNRKIRKVTLTS